MNHHCYQNNLIIVKFFYKGSVHTIVHTSTSIRYYYPESSHKFTTYFLLDLRYRIGKTAIEFEILAQLIYFFIRTLHNGHILCFMCRKWDILINDLTI